MDNKKFETLMYYLVKGAARDSFVDFLEYIGLTMQEYDEIAEHLEETYGINMYL
jgi:phenylalanine-4-hydroxylase